MPHVDDSETPKKIAELKAPPPGLEFLKELSDPQHIIHLRDAYLKLSKLRVSLGSQPEKAAQFIGDGFDLVLEVAGHNPPLARRLVHEMGMAARESADLGTLFFDKALESAPVFVAKAPDVAGWLLQPAVRIAGKNETRLQQIVDAGLDLLPQTAAANGQDAHHLLSAMFVVAAGNVSLTTQVFDAGLSQVRTIAEDDPRAAKDVIDTLRVQAGDDPLRPVIYKEFSVTSESPDDTEQHLVFFPGKKGGDKPYVLVGQDGDTLDVFRRKVKFIYNDQVKGVKRDAKLHFEGLLAYVDDGRFAKSSAETVSIRDYFNARIDEKKTDAEITRLPVFWPLHEWKVTR